MSETIWNWFATIPFFSAPFLLATTGLIINERAGVLNLGAEGVMAMSAVLSVIAVLMGADPYVGLLFGIAAALATALVFVFLAVVLRINQVLAGLVLFALGIGASGYIGADYVNQPINGIVPFNLHEGLGLSESLGRLIDQDSITIFAFVSAIAVWWGLEKTDFGLRLRAVGEDAPAADAAGVNVFSMRCLAVLGGAVFLALAGAHLALVGSHIWVEGMVNGRGWIAVAMVTFSRWKPVNAIWAALLFGAVDAAIPRLLSSGLSVPVYLIQMTPYIVTMVFLCLAGALQRGESAQPQDLARPYLREERR